MSTDIVVPRSTLSQDNKIEMEFGNGALQALNDGVSGLNATILLQVLNSDNGNTLKSRLLQLLTDELNSKLSKKNKLSKVYISEVLSAEEQLWLSNAYSDLNLVFNNNSVRSHAYSSASRTCERAVLFNKMNFDPYVICNEIRVKEVGGDVITSLLRGERGVHYCSPILNNYDGNRHGGRLFTAHNTLSNKIIKDEYSLQTLKEFIECAGNLKHNNSVFCFEKSQNCKVKANVLMFLHSTYDMSLTEVGDCMDSAEAMVAYGSFIFSSIILTEDKGLIPKLNADFYITRDKNGKRKQIRFGFKHCNGFNYQHNYYNYEKFITTSQFKSSNDKVYSLELLENRDGIQFFKITKLTYSLRSSLPHRVYMDHLKDKYIVRFPMCQYSNKQSKDKKYYSVRTKSGAIIKIKQGDYLGWTTLPKNTLWRTFVIDAKIIDKTMAYVAGASDEKFKPDQVIQYLRSVATRDMMYTSVAPKNDLPPVEDLCAIAHAIYLSLYHNKYMFGKVLQQGILETNALRTGVKARDVLKEFDRRDGLYIRLLKFIKGEKKNLFDPTIFIVPPLDFLEFDNLLGESVLKVDANFSRIYDLSKIIVTSKLLSDQNDLYKYEDNIPKFEGTNYRKDKFIKRTWRKFLSLIKFRCVRGKLRKLVGLFKVSKKHIKKILKMILKPFSFTKKMITKIFVGIFCGVTVALYGIGYSAGMVIKGGKVVLKTSTNLFRRSTKYVKNLVTRYKRYQEKLLEQQHQKELDLLKDIVAQRDVVYEKLMKIRKTKDVNQKSFLKGFSGSGSFRLLSKTKQEKLLEKELDSLNEFIVCWTNLIIQTHKKIPEFIDTISVHDNESIEEKELLLTLIDKFKNKGDVETKFSIKNIFGKINKRKISDLKKDDKEIEMVEIKLDRELDSGSEIKDFELNLNFGKEKSDSDENSDGELNFSGSSEESKISNPSMSNKTSKVSNLDIEENCGKTDNSSSDDSFVTITTIKQASKSTDTLLQISNLPLDNSIVSEKPEKPPRTKKNKSFFNNRTIINKRSYTELSNLTDEMQVKIILMERGYPLFSGQLMIPSLVNKIVYDNCSMNLNDVIADLETTNCEVINRPYNFNKFNIEFEGKLSFIDPTVEYPISSLNNIFEYVRNLDCDNYINNKGRQLLKLYSLLEYSPLYGEILELGSAPGTWTVEILNKFAFKLFDAVSPVGENYLATNADLRNLIGSPNFKLHEMTSEEFLLNTTSTYDVVICDVATENSWLNNDQLDLIPSIIKVLKPEGSLILKISNLFLEGLNEHLLSIDCFEQLFVVKPDGSRLRSTEVYLVGVNFGTVLKEPVFGLNVARDTVSEFYNNLLVGNSIEKIDAMVLLEEKIRSLHKLIDTSTRSPSLSVAQETEIIFEEIIDREIEKPVGVFPVICEVELPLLKYVESVPRVLQHRENIPPLIPKRVKKKPVYNETTEPIPSAQKGMLTNLVNLFLKSEPGVKAGVKFVGELSNTIDKSVIITESKVYPRQAIYKNDKNLLDVDGSKFECLFIALCEDREVDITDLRFKLAKLSNPTPDLIDELKVGNMAGSAVIEAFVKLYSVRVFVEYEINGKKDIGIFYNDDPKIKTFRSIPLVLSNQHYYIKNNCHEEFPIKLQRYKMYQNFDLLTFRTMLLSIISFKPLENFGELQSVSSDGIYFINNLSKLCLVHYECRNNNMLKLFKVLDDKRAHNITLITLYEKENFDIDYLEYLLTKFPCLSVKFLDLNLGGYFSAVIYHTLVTDVSTVIKANYKIFNDHVCPKGKLKNISLQGNSGTFLTCVKSGEKGCYSDPNILIELRKSNLNKNNLVLINLPTHLVVEGVGENGCCENISKVASAVSTFLNYRQKVLFIQYKTDFTNNELVIALIKQKCDYFQVSLDAVVSVDSVVTVPYFCDSTDDGVKKNSMVEQFQIWENDTNVVSNTLKDAYNILFPVIREGNKKLEMNVDNSTALFDVNYGKFIYGQRIETPYFYGYAPQGLIPTKDLFDNTGGINMAKLNDYRRRGIPYICFNKNSKLLHAVEFVQKYTIEGIKDFKICTFKDVRGGPGCGKSTFILNMVANRPSSMIVTMTKEGSNDLKRRIKDQGLKFELERVRTGDSLLLNGTNLIVDVLFIDEARLVHCGQWLWLAYVTKCREVYVVGDPFQISYGNRNGYSVYRSTPSNWNFDDILHLKFNHRNPLDAVAMMNNYGMHDFEIKGTSELIRSMDVVQINGEADINISEDVKVLVFTQSEKSTLKHKYPNVNTVHEFQGNQCDYVALVRLVHKDSDTVYSSKSHALVALSRHRIKLTYYTTRIGDMVSNMIATTQKYTDNDILGHKHVGHINDGLDDLYTNKVSLKGGADIQIRETIKPDFAISLYLKEKKIRAVVYKNQESGYVSWSYKRELVFPEYINKEVPFIKDYSLYDLQEFLDSALPGSSTEFREFDHERFEYETPMHVEGISVGLAIPTYKKYDRLLSKLRTSIQYPIHNSQKLNIKAFIERNGMVPQLQGNIDDKFRAMQLVRDFKKICDYKDTYRNNQIRMNFVNLSEWLDRQPPTIMSILSSEEGIFDQQLTVYDFLIKTISKIDLEIGAEWRYKSPQTIAHQKKIINSVFCPVLKDMMDRVEHSLDYRFVLYNNMSPQEFAGYLSQIFPLNAYMENQHFYEIDFSKYDKSQGLVILYFEVMLMEEFGVPADYLKLWIIMHKYTLIIDRINRFHGHVEYQRKSGDAGTWRLNTLVQIAILNTVFRLHEQTKFIGCFSGDDSLMFMDPVSHIDLKLSKLQNVYNLEAKLMHYKIPYFCSKFLIMTEKNWIFVPDLIKLLIKLGRNDLVDFEHVECYRISFDDNLYFYKDKRNWPYINLAVNDRYKLTGEHDYIYNTLLALVQTSERFATLYYERVGHVRGVISSKPKLEL